MSTEQTSTNKEGREPGLSGADGSDLPRVDSIPGKIIKYTPAHEPVHPSDLLVATDVVMQIVKAFDSNFQNTEHDLARLITDRFTLRNHSPNAGGQT
jgi:hypothetical protein